METPLKYMKILSVFLFMVACVESSPLSNKEKRDYECRDTLPNCLTIARDGDCARYEQQCMRTCDYCPLDQDVCTTPECIEVAERIRKYSDPTVRPCDNFYDFACGNFVKKMEYPKGKTMLISFLMVSDETRDKIKGILNEPVSADDIPPLVAAKNHFTACKDVDTLTARGDLFFKDILHNEILEVPMLSATWNERNFDLTQALINAFKHSSSPLFGFHEGFDDIDSTKKVLELSEPWLGMGPHSYYLKSRDDLKIMAWQESWVRTFQNLGPANPSTLTQDIADVVDLEVKLAKIKLPREQMRDRAARYNPMTLSAIDQEYSGEGLDLKRFVQGLMGSPAIGVTDIGDDEVLIVNVKGYFKKLNKILAETPKRTIANYIAVVVANTWRDYLSPAQAGILHDYDQVMYGPQARLDRPELCLDTIYNDLAYLLSKPFVDRYFDHDAKAKADDMITELTRAFDELVQELPWMDAETKEKALEKRRAMGKSIGYPDYLVDTESVIERYRNYTFTPTTWFENVWILGQELTALKLRNYRQPIDNDKWEIAPNKVNAFYMPPKNEIVFPAAILQPPFFHKAYPRYLNYGGIGMVIGHEITHGFDDSGRQYDKNGNRNNWWSDEAIEHFKGKAQCIEHQYGNYTMPELGNMPLNGKATCGENIADNGGLKQTYRAYRNWVRSQGQEEPLLPNLPYTQNQLLFISFAQVFCDKMTADSREQQIRGDSHSPGRYRVNGPAKNSRAFSEAFGCARGTFMNPEEKCHVW